MNSPFFHEEVEVKQQFLQLARDLYGQSEDIEKLLASAMLYANLCEYLAYHLCESLKQTIFSGSKAFWNGAVYLDLRDTTEKKTIGQIAIELEKYGFPSKEIIKPIIKRIASNRNIIMHNMLRMPANDLDKVDAAIRELVSDSETLIGAIDDIYRGLPPSNITQQINEVSEVVATKNNDGEITVQDKERTDGDRTSKRTTRKKAS